MPNTQEVLPLPDFINQSALETEGKWHERLLKTNTRMMRMMMMMIGGQWGRGETPPPLEYNH